MSNKVQGVQVDMNISQGSIPQLGPNIPIRAARIPRPQIRRPTLIRRSQAPLPVNPVVVDTMAGLKQGLNSLQGLANEFIKEDAKKRQEEIKRVANQAQSQAIAEDGALDAPNPYTDPEYAKAFDKGIQEGRIFNAGINVDKVIRENIINYKNKPDAITTELFNKTLEQLEGIDDGVIRQKMIAKIKQDLDNKKLQIEKANRQEALQLQITDNITNLQEVRDIGLSELARDGAMSEDNQQKILDGVKIIYKLNPKKGRQLMYQLSEQIEVAQLDGIVANAKKFGLESMEKAVEAFKQGKLKVGNPFNNKERTIVFDPGKQQRLIRRYEAEIRNAKTNIRNTRTAALNFLNNKLKATLSGERPNRAMDDYANEVKAQLPPKEQAEFTIKQNIADNINSRIQELKKGANFNEVTKTMIDLENERRQAVANAKDLKATSFYNKAYTEGMKTIQQYARNIRKNPWQNQKFPENQFEADVIFAKLRSKTGLKHIPAPREMIQSFNDRWNSEPEVVYQQLLQTRNAIGKTRYKNIIDSELSKDIPKIIKVSIAGGVSQEEAFATNNYIIHGRKMRADDKGAKIASKTRKRLNDLIGVAARGIDNETMKDVVSAAMSIANEKEDRTPDDDTLKQAWKKVTAGQKLIEVDGKIVSSTEQEADAPAIEEALDDIRNNPGKYGLPDIDTDDYTVTQKRNGDFGLVKNGKFVPGVSINARGEVNDWVDINGSFAEQQPQVINEDYQDPWLKKMGVTPEHQQRLNGIIQEWMKTGKVNKYDYSEYFGRIPSLSLESGGIMPEPRLVEVRDIARQNLMKQIAEKRIPVVDGQGDAMSPAQMLVAATEQIRTMNPGDTAAFGEYNIEIPGVKHLHVPSSLTPKVKQELRSMSEQQKKTQALIEKTQREADELQKKIDQTLKQYRISDELGEGGA